jgi:hypothetical protein
MGSNYSLPKTLYSTGILHELRRRRACGAREQRECNEALFDKTHGPSSSLEELQNFLVLVEDLLKAGDPVRIDRDANLQPVALQ